MKVAVVGLWHLGSVTAACLANLGHEVVAFDPNQSTIESLIQGRSPLFEPSLDDLIKTAQFNHALQFTYDKQDLHDSDIVWITFDTPVDEQDKADVNAVIEQVIQLFPYLKSSAIVLISSQVPVGTTRQLIQSCQVMFSSKQISFAYSPENLRLGKAIEVFTQPDRVIIGISSEDQKSKLMELFYPITEHLIWMSLESAEMSKHALNAFLATSVVFINELATLCEQVGALAKDVERALKSEERIGPKAYLRPGTAIAGGTLARDVNFLTQLSASCGVKTPLLSSVLKSNQYHMQWACRRVKEVLDDLEGKKIVVLGLTYKVGTDTLRRSLAIETCLWLHAQRASVVAYDPVVKILESSLGDKIDLQSSVIEAIREADAIILSTEWPEFLDLSVEQVVSLMKQPYVFDAGGFLENKLGHHERINYYTVGSQT